MPASQANNKPLLLLLFLIVLSPLGIDIFLSAIPSISISFAVPTSSVQSTIALYLLAGGIGQLFIGQLADRFGRRPTLLFGIVSYIGGAVLASVAMHIETLWVSRIIQGIGSSAISISIMATVRDHYGEKQSGKIYSYVVGAIYIVPAIAPMLGAWLTKTFDWRFNFWFMAAYALIMLGVASASFKESKPKQTLQDQSISSLKQYRNILSNSSFFIYAVLVMLSMAIVVQFLTVSPMILVVQMGLDTTSFSLWFGLNAIVTIIGAYLAPKFVNMTGVKRAIWIGCIVNLVSAFWLLKASHCPLSFMAPVFLSSLGLCLLFATCSSSALAAFGDNAGKASALLGFVQMSGSSLLVALTQRFPLTAIESFGVIMMLPLVWWGCTQWIAKKQNKLSTKVAG